MTSSIVSFSKREILEEIPGMMSGIFRIPACVSFAEPSILYVEDGYYYKPDLDGNQDRVLVQSADLVQSLVHMHNTSQIGARGDQHPAVFAIPNEKATVADVFKTHKRTVDEYLKRQRKWYEALVRLADDDWQQVKRHRMISDVQRTAAMELGLTREWLNTVYDEEKETIPSCPFCGTNLLDSNAPICPACGRIHNPAKLAELEARIQGTTAKTKG